VQRVYVHQNVQMVQMVGWKCDLHIVWRCSKYILGKMR